MGDEEHIKDIVKQHGEITEKLGFGRLMGEVWTALSIIEPMTQDELKKYFNSSTSAVSQAIKPLETMGMIKIVGKKGRKNIYSADGSMNCVKRKAMEIKIKVQIEPMLALIAEKKKVIKGKETKEKLEKLEKRFSRINKIMKIIMALPIWKKEDTNQ